MTVPRHETEAPAHLSGRALLLESGCQAFFTQVVAELVHVDLYGCAIGVVLALLGFELGEKQQLPADLFVSVGRALTEPCGGLGEGHHELGH